MVILKAAAVDVVSIHLIIPKLPQFVFATPKGTSANCFATVVFQLLHF
jgi:hypothetical protein